MIESSRLIAPTREVRLTPDGLAFHVRPVIGMIKGIDRIALLDPDAVPGVFTDASESEQRIGQFIREYGAAADDFGGPREGPVWWEEPYLVWAVSAHRGVAPAKPRGAKLVTRSLRSESGRIAVVMAAPWVGRELAEARRAGRACLFKLPYQRWHLSYLQYDPPAGTDAAAARDVVLRHEPPATPATPPGPWDVEINLEPIQTLEEFFALVSRELRLGDRPLEEFWSGFDEMVTSRGHTGMLTVRLLGWTAFERRLPDTALNWRQGIRYLRTTLEQRFVRAEYDDPPQGPALVTQRCSVLLAAGSDLTLPALADRLRAGRSRLTVVETGDRLTVTGGLEIHVGPLTDPAELAEVRTRQFVDGFVRTPMPDGDAEADEVAAATAVLEVWTTSPNPGGRSQARAWAAVLRTIEGFRRAYLTDVEPETPAE